MRSLKTNIILLNAFVYRHYLPSIMRWSTGSSAWCVQGRVTSKIHLTQREVTRITVAVEYQLWNFIPKRRCLRAANKQMANVLTIRRTERAGRGGNLILHRLFVA